MESRRILTVAVLLILLVCLGAHATSNYPPPPNIRITYYPELNNEQQAWICPTDTSVVIANWRDFRLGYRQIGLGISRDGGLTWIDSLVNRSMQYFTLDSKQSDPTLTADQFGNFYMCNLDYDGFGLTNLSTISFYKSTDLGVSWTGPVPMVWTGDPNIFEDKQFITVDRTGGPYNGNIYCSWTRFPNPDRIVLVRSIDGGASFEDTVVVGGIQTSTACGTTEIDAGQFSIPVVTSNGDVHVFWMGFSLDSSDCAGFTAMKHVVSTDGGVSFTSENIVQQVSGYTEADGGIATYSQPAADADISGGPFDGNIYIAFTNRGMEDAENTDVDFVYSEDNGMTWSYRYQINDDDNSDNYDNFHPWLVVNEEGVIAVLFYDQRFDTTNHIMFDAFAAYSFDGGRTFTTNHRISSASSHPGSLKINENEAPVIKDENGMIIAQPLSGRAGLIGEYIGFSVVYDKCLAVWTDSRDGNSECYSATWNLPLLEPRLVQPDDGAYRNESILFQWSTMWKHNEDRYRIEICDDSTFFDKVYSRIIDTNRFMLDTALNDGVYYWRVKSFKTINSDSSDYSPVRSFELDKTPPDAPTLISPVDSAVILGLPFDFDWSDATKAAPVYYNLYLSQDSTFPAYPGSEIYAYLENSLYTFDDSLETGVPYYWKVYARDETGNTSASSEIFTLTYYEYICGDFDGDGKVNIVDLTNLVAYLFTGGEAPPIPASMDIDEDGKVNIVDLTLLVGYLFGDGSPLEC